MAYITKSDIEKYLGITIDATLQTFIDLLVGMAEEYIETYCGGGEIARRKFVAPSPDTATVRYYDGKGLTKCKIDDLREIVSLVADGVTLTKDEDFYLSPANAVADGQPYEWIELIQPQTRLTGNVNSRIDITAPYIFWDKQRNVVVTGKFGYSATVPSAVKIACMKLCGVIIKENIGDTDLREISAQSLGDYSVDFEKVTNAANETNINSLLDLYKRKSNAKKSGSFIAK
jgi:hypothetical protein